MTRRIITLLLLVSLTLFGCGGDEPAGTTATTTAPPATSSTVVDAGGYATWLLLEPAGVRDASIVPVYRPAPSAPTFEQRVATLLAGYTFTEAGFGIGTSIPFEVGIRFVDGPVDGVATVDLSEPFGGDADPATMRTRLAQLVYTATEHPGVESVAVLVNGELPPPAEGLDVSVPLSRLDLAWSLERVALLDPMVLQPGIGSTISIDGLATADAVGFEVVDSSGNELASGTVSTEDRGDPSGLATFSALVDLAPAPPGDLCLIRVWVDVPRQELTVPFYAAG